MRSILAALLIVPLLVPPGAVRAEPSARTPAPCLELSTSPLALSAGDLDGDGREELLVLTRDELRALRPGDPRCAHYAALSLTRRPRSRAPTRAAVGALAAADLDGDGQDEVAFSTSDLQAGSVVYWTGLRFREVRTLVDLPVGLAVLDGEPTFFLGALLPGTSTFGAAALTPVQRDDPVPQGLAVPSLSLAAEPSLEHLAALSPEGELVVWGRDGAVVGRLQGVGQAFALRELEGEILPELVVTDPVLAPTPDRVRVLALGGEGPRLLWASEPLRGQVVAVTVLDRGDGQRSVFYALVPADGSATRLVEVRW